MPLRQYTWKCIEISLSEWTLCSLKENIALHCMSMESKAFFRWSDLIHLSLNAPFRQYTRKMHRKILVWTKPLFTEREPHSPLVVDGERGFFSVNRPIILIECGSGPAVLCWLWLPSRLGRWKDVAGDRRQAALAVTCTALCNYCIYIGHTKMTSSRSLGKPSGTSLDIIWDILPSTDSS